MHDALFGGPFVLNDFTVKKEEMAGVFAKATLDSIGREWEKQKHDFATMFCLVKAMVFPVVMYGYES